MGEEGLGFTELSIIGGMVVYASKTLINGVLHTVLPYLHKKNGKPEPEKNAERRAGQSEVIKHLIAQTNLIQAMGTSHHEDVRSFITAAVANGETLKALTDEIKNRQAKQLSENTAAVNRNGLILVEIKTVLQERNG